ncbi:MAG: MFS transporter [Oscillospiraceae bacterium]|jgi:MFS family permease|nr:MFS transporter [Oscillospiraceae bacterium]
MKNEKIWNRMYLCAFIANFLHNTAQFTVSPLVAAYAGSLGATASVIGVISGMFYGVAFAVRPFSGPVITKLNRKHIMLAAYAVGVLVNGGYALSSSLPLFVAARFLHGLQFAFIGSLTLTIAGDSLPAAKMGSGLGIFGVNTAVATAIAPGMGLFLREWGAVRFGGNAGYTAVFAFAAACMALSIIPVLAMPYKPLTREQRGEIGAWYKNIAAKETLVPALVIAFICFASILYTFYMESFAREQNIANIGLFFTVYALVLLCARPISGHILDRYGIAAVVYPALAIFAASFIIVGLGKRFETCVVGAALAAIGYGAAQPALQTMAIKSVHPLRRGVASNTAYFGMDLGYWLGPTIGGAIISGSSIATLYTSAALPAVIAALIFALGQRARKKSRLQE